MEVKDKALYLACFFYLLFILYKTIRLYLYTITKYLDRKNLSELRLLHIHIDIFISCEHNSLIVFMKLILSLGDITTEPLRKLNSKRSNEAAGADKNVLVAFIDCISSIIKLSEERKLHLTTKRFPSMIYFMLNKSEIINIINTNIT